jgi:hypothetical protein
MFQKLKPPTLSHPQIIIQNNVVIMQTPGFFFPQTNNMSNPNKKNLKNLIYKKL